MNAPDRFVLHDVQSRPDSRNLRIDAVGVKGMRYPVTIEVDVRVIPTIGTFSMTVVLEATDRGTHMSRFVELLEAQARALTIAGFKRMATDMLERLHAPSGAIELRFPYFVRKTAPVSGVESQLDYEVCWRASVSDRGTRAFWMEVAVPATSLCPCSKEISEYGAHNQRSCITIGVEVVHDLPVEDLIGMAARRLQRGLWITEAGGREIRHRARLRQSEVRRRHRSRRGIGIERGQPDRSVRRRSGKLRVDPQPLGVRSDRLEACPVKIEDYAPIGACAKVRSPRSSELK